MSKRTVVWFAGFGLMLLAACGGGQQSDDELRAASESCLPGSVFSCVRWNCSGFQRCADDGSGLMPCVCNGIDAGDVPAAPPDAGKPALTSSKPPTAATKPDAGATLPAPDVGTNPSGNDAGSTPRSPTPDTDPDTDTDAGNPLERCDNGKDDDADGLADCADPDCTETRCVPAAPEGWRGPVAFRVATAANSCTRDFDRLAFEASDQPEAEPATCSKCSCTGGSCSTFLEFGTSNGAACGGESCTTSVNASCVEIRPQCLQNATTASLATILPAGASCASAKQEPIIPPARWKTRVTACESSAPQRTGCSAGALCLPAQPGNGFEAPYCIWREGQHPCTHATFPRPRVYYRSLSDTRACSECSCAVDGCNYSWQVFNADDLSCTAPLLQLSSADQCAQINPEAGRLRVGATITGTGTCTAAGGEARGTITAEDPITMCCNN